MLVTLTHDEIAAIHAEHRSRDWSVFSADESERFDLDVFGIAGESREADLYDDAMGATWRGDDGVLTGILFRATVDPGRKWLENPMRASGTASLLRPHYYEKIWRAGLYKGQKALLAQGLVKVLRDADRDLIHDADPSHVYEDGTGIHGHGPFRIDPKTVGGSSAACQVGWRQAYIDRLFDLVMLQKKHGNGDAVSYGLHDVRVSPVLLPILARVRA